MIGTWVLRTVAAAEHSIEWLAPGQMLRSARRLARMSQREVADRAGVPKSTIGRIELAETRWPTMEVMHKLLAVTEHYLVAVDRTGVLQPTAEVKSRQMAQSNVRVTAFFHWA